jgi:DNA-binding transcriptional ArsR family regulator
VCPSSRYNVDGSHEVLVQEIGSEGILQPEARPESFSGGSSGWVRRRSAVDPCTDNRWIPGHVQMEKALWYLLVGTRGGENRARIIVALDERPRNANQLAECLDVAYTTVRHHLAMLREHDVIEPGDDEYGKLYFLTDRFEHHREEFETVMEAM